MMRSLLAMLVLASSLIQAAPRKEQLMDTNLLQREDLAYRFSSLDLDSDDGRRHYRLWLGQPNSPAPAGGYPIVWMLDGNAALGVLDPALLRRLAAGRAPLLVALGYQTSLRIEHTARVFDYTPPREGRIGLADPLTGQPSGGADIFLELFERRLRPAVAQRVPLAVGEQTLWGHSYAGLLVLRALFCRPYLVDHYAVASPSLWWGDGAWLPGCRQAPPHGSVLLSRGSVEERKAGTGQPSSEQALGDLAQILQGMDGLALEVKRFPGLGHGPALGASLRYLLESRFATQP